MNKIILTSLIFSIIFFAISFYSFEIVKANDNEKLSYAIVDTGVVDFYSDKAKINKPNKGENFYGQDAHYKRNIASYTDNKDGTITDNITGLMWQQDMGRKMTYKEAVEYSKKLNLAGHTDWRIPTIKELYSLIDYKGQSGGEVAKKLYIDTKYFKQPIGNKDLGEREIDAQTWSSTHYVGRVMANNAEAIFGVNFIDGRIKGYPLKRRNQENKMYFRLVRGNENYGKNNFVDNGDGTISDLATGLMWQKDDSKKGMDWRNALAYAENLKLANHEDWRLPNAKELQSIVDYSRSLQTTNSPAIDPIFNTSKISLLSKENQYPYFWTSTSHLDGRNIYDSAVYIAFGEAYGEMNKKTLDVHGAGAQRSDPKAGNAKNFPSSFGPQGDIRLVYNYVRAVRTRDTP